MSRSWGLITVVLVFNILLNFGFQTGVCAQDLQQRDSLREVLTTDISDSLRIAVMDKLSRTYYPYNMDSAVNIIARALESNPKGQNLKPHIYGLWHWTFLLIELDQFNGAVDKANEALELSYLHEDRDFERGANVQLGYVYSRFKRQDKAIPYKKRVLEISKEMGADPNHIVVAITNLITSLYNNGEPDKAFDQLMQVKPYLDSARLTDEFRAEIYEKLRFFHRYRGELEEALFYNKKCYEQRVNEKDIKGQIRELGSLGRIYVKMNDLKNANEHFKQANLLQEKHNIGYLKFDLLDRRGNVNIKMKRYHMALKLFKDQLDFTLKEGAKHEIARAYANIGEVYVNLKKPLVAQTFLTKSASLFKEIIKDKSDPLSHKDLAMAYQSLSHFDSLMGNSRSSLENFRKFIIYEDSSRLSKMHNKLDEIDIKYDAYYKDKEIKVLNAKNELQQLKMQQQRWFSLFATGGGLTLLMFFLLLYKRYSEKNRNLILIQKKGKEKELLVREIHHRVKNNLQIMLSLLNIQTNMINDKQARNMVTESKNRIQSMALIHQNLYRSGNMVMVEANEYFEDLVQNIIASFKNHDKDISLNTHITSNKICMKIAVPVGLILNELITNSIKYAFKDMKGGELTIHFEKDEVEEYYHLRVTDNGRGLPEEFQINNTASFGLNLVKGLTEQLEGSINVFNEAGTCYDIYLKDKEAA